MKHANLVNAVLAAGYDVESTDTFDFSVRNGQAQVEWTNVGGEIGWIKVCYHESNKHYNFSVDRPTPKSIKDIVQFLKTGDFNVDRVQQALGNYRDELYEGFFDKATDLHKFIGKFVEKYQMSWERRKRVIEAANVIDKMIQDIGRICVEQDKEDEKDAD